MAKTKRYTVTVDEKDLTKPRRTWGGFKPATRDHGHPKKAASKKACRGKVQW